MAQFREAYWLTIPLRHGLRLGGEATAYGYRYTADGWSEMQPLFRFVGIQGDAVVGDPAPTLLQQAQAIAIHGTGGAATHGCEDVRQVRWG